jgi:hypothetical protein
VANTDSDTDDLNLIFPKNNGLRKCFFDNTKVDIDTKNPLFNTYNV